MSSSILLGHLYRTNQLFYPNWHTDGAHEKILSSAGLDEAQAGIKIAGRNINNLRYADDNTFIPESKEELKSLLMKVKEENEKAGLKLNIQKIKIMASDPIASCQIDGKHWKQWQTIFLGSKITTGGDLQPWN